MKNKKQPKPTNYTIITQPARKETWKEKPSVVVDLFPQQETILSPWCININLKQGMNAYQGALGTVS